MTRFSVLLLAGLLFAPTAASAITAGQIDDFEGGTVMGWSEGFFSPNAPTNVTTGGPAGAGDNYLRNIASGSPSAAGGKMTMFNQAQWTGNYVAAGVGVIQVALANFGANPLAIRLAIEGPDGTRFGSATAFALPADDQWYMATLSLAPGDMALIEGLATLNAVLGNVVTLRILSRAADVGWQGDAIAGALGVDNIRAGLPSAVGDPLNPAIRLLANTPNPFTRSTVIQYELSRESPVAIDIFDLAGRSVRRIESSAAQSPGRHEVAWDGRSDDGAILPAGVYFYRLTSADFVETRKMLLVAE